MASAASGITITSVSTEIFIAAVDGGRCSKFLIGCRTSSAFAVLISIPGLHKEDEWLGLPIGTSQEFSLTPNGMASVLVKGDGGDTLLDYGVVERIS